MIYWQLFVSFFQIGLFSVGGGYAALPLIQQQVVDLYGWLLMPEFVDVITISQMTPGPIAINAATFVGMRIAGLLGAVVATLGCVAPSVVIVLTIAYFYFKFKNLTAIQGALFGLRPAVVSLIAVAGLSLLLSALFSGAAQSWFAICLKDFDAVAFLLFAAGFFVLRKWRVNPVYVMLGCGALGLLLYQFYPVS